MNFFCCRSKIFVVVANSLTFLSITSCGGNKLNDENKNLEKQSITNSVEEGYDPEAADVYADPILDLEEADDYYVKYKIINPNAIIYQNENLSKKLCSTLPVNKSVVAVLAVEELKKDPKTGTTKNVYKIVSADPKKDPLCASSKKFTIPLKDAYYGYILAKDITKVKYPNIDDNLYNENIDGIAEDYGDDSIFNEFTGLGDESNLNMYRMLTSKVKITPNMPKKPANLAIFYAKNYDSVRQNVASWFAKKYSPTATLNGCAAHVSTALKLFNLPYPRLGTLASINADAMSVWFNKHGWKRVRGRSNLKRSDIIFSGSSKNLTHVFVFTNYKDKPNIAHILDNQSWGVHPRGLHRGPMQFAYRYPANK